MFKLKKNQQMSRDIAVIISDDGTADVAYVIDTDSDRILAENETHDYAIPIADCRHYVGSRGRIYVYGAVPECIQDTKRLAELEKSTVLKQITMYKKPEEKPFDVMKIVLTAGIVIVAVVAAI